MPKFFQQTDEQLGQYTLRLNEDHWFETQQPTLLRMANTDGGKDLLCIPKNYKKIFKFGKNHIFYNPRIEGKKFKYDWDFRVGAKWANVIRYRWTEFQNMAVYFQDAIPFKPVTLVGVKVAYAFGGPYYPDPNPTTTSVDGTLAYTAGNASWATARGAASATAESSGVDSNVNLRTPDAEISGGLYYIARGFVLFDTAAIPDTDTISAATLSLYGTSTVNNSDTAGIDIVQGTPASNTSLTGTDYAQTGTTVFSTKALSAWSTSAYNDFALDANGIANISKTGVSKFATRITRDTANSAPTGANNCVHIMADTAGTTTDPKLTGTSAAPGLAGAMSANRGYWG